MTQPPRTVTEESYLPEPVGDDSVQPTGATPPLTVKVIGVGRFGSRLLPGLVDNPRISGTLAIHTDQRLVASARAEQSLLLGPGTSLAGNCIRGRALARAQSLELDDALGEADVFLVVGGQGGSTGSGVLPEVAALAQKKGFTFVLTSLPFAFEAPRRSRVAELALRRLSRLNIPTFTLPNETLAAGLGARGAFREALDMGTTQLMSGIRALSASAAGPALIDMGPADIQGLFRATPNARGIFASAAGDGSVPFSDLMERALRQALSGNQPGDTGALLFTIRTHRDYDLRMNALAAALDRVRPHLGDQANITFGAWCEEDDLAPSCVVVDLFSVSKG